MRRIVVMLMLLAGPAGAQPSDNKALAEQLFNQARDLAKANNWAEARGHEAASPRSPDRSTVCGPRSWEPPPSPSDGGPVPPAPPLPETPPDPAGRAADSAPRHPPR